MVAPGRDGVDLAEIGRDLVLPQLIQSPALDAAVGDGAGIPISHGESARETEVLRHVQGAVLVVAPALDAVVGLHACVVTAGYERARRAKALGDLELTHRR
jgi:hypothetical protein